VWRWDQAEPFGNNPADEDPDANSVAFDLPLRLPGQRYDAETGLHYNYFRDYDPSIGRYGESDPIGLNGGLNTYAYVGLDPTGKSDPLGLFMPGRHYEITRNAASGSCPAAAGGLAYSVMQADNIPGTQLPGNAPQHAMCAPGQSAAQGAQATEQFIDEQLRTCSLQGLERALHAAQDKHAGGHRGCQTWPGGSPSWHHIVQDAFPGSAAGAAEAESRAVIGRFRAMCPCSVCK
jgi:RHS repeat-associated protein